RHGAAPSSHRRLQPRRRGHPYRPPCPGLGLEQSELTIRAVQYAPTRGAQIGLLPLTRSFAFAHDHPLPACRALGKMRFLHKAKKLSLLLRRNAGEGGRWPDEVVLAVARTPRLGQR